MFSIDIMSRIPVYEQLINQVQENILLGILKPGDKMVSVRNLSMELSVNPNTIQKAYTELDRLGLITTVPGKGSFISQDALDLVSSLSREKLEDVRHLIEEVKKAGVTRKELVDLIEEIYKEN
ncbi:MAG: GntR family transcriptional regulator [Lachnospira sp.]|nr:GntR family transcriptional regulator [Lachnospira sp.]